jgi:hypothetical protein
MKKPVSKLVARSSDVVLGDRTFAAITAVEGLELTASSRKRMADMKKRKLSGDEQRSEIVHAYLAAKSRG